MSAQKPSAFATGEGPPIGPASTTLSPLGPHGFARGWSFPQEATEMPPTPTSFAPAQTVAPGPEASAVQPHLGVSNSVSGNSMNTSASQSHQSSTIKRRMSRHQSLPVLGDQFTSMVKRQEAARLRKISNGLSRSASGGSASIMGAPTPVNVAGAGASSMKGAAGQAQHIHSTSSMLSSVQSTSQMSSLMQASIMQSSMMLTQMMNQRIASNNAAFRHSHLPHGHQVQQGKTVAPAHGQVHQMPSHSMQIPTSMSTGVKPQPASYSTMMPPRPAINMSVQMAQPAHGPQPDAPLSTRKAPSPEAQISAASPPLEPSARVAAELVVTLGAKMKEICEQQTVLVEQMQRMRQKIDEKDEIIRKLQENEKADMAVHKQERVEMSDEFASLKEQVQSMQSLIEAAERATPRDIVSDSVAKQLSDLNTDSGGTEEDSSTTKGDDPDGEPSTPSTVDGKATSRPSSITRSPGTYYFKPITDSSLRKRRELDELFMPKDSQGSQRSTS